MNEAAGVADVGGTTDATDVTGVTGVTGAEDSVGSVGPADALGLAGRRGAGDPVKVLMHRHRELCERAVDPLEIAAGLETHGMTDRTAARFRHRDVFALAEEMYARVPRAEERTSASAAGPEPMSAKARAQARLSETRAGSTHRPGRTSSRLRTLGRVALVLSPGALCAAAMAGVRLTDGRPRLTVAATGALVVALALVAVLRHGPLRTPHRPANSARAWTCWLLAYALIGDGLLDAAVGGGPDGPWPLTTAPLLVLTLACAPAAWCAHLFATGARRRLTASRGLEEFTASVRPMLLGTFALYLCLLGALLTLCATALDQPVAHVPVPYESVLHGPAAHGSVMPGPAAHGSVMPGPAAHGFVMDGFAAHGSVMHEPVTYAAIGALATLLPLARLLTAYGCTRAPSVALCAAGATEAAALCTVFAGRLPGCSAVAAPVEAVVGTWGPGAVPAGACGVAAVALLIHATRALTRASAHATPAGATR
ncbi:hypothetical protein [Streptomyces sp. NPDC059786]|uniref:hypothetical protein n=1 Tax=Streptomyces sp. NPDC059786 TaxID=3346946 RepID=UPI0036484869